MDDAPRRIQRSRAKGWRMPEGAIYVGRGSVYGNPFVVGADGTAADCARLYRLLLGGLVCLSCAATPAAQEAARRSALDHIGQLRGRDLACWCRRGQPCHADVLLDLANAPLRCEAT
jgi:hypothetical protein